MDIHPSQGPNPRSRFVTGWKDSGLRSTIPVPGLGSGLLCREYVWQAQFARSLFVRATHHDIFQFRTVGAWQAALGLLPVPLRDTA